MLPNASVPRGGYSGGGIVVAAADRRGSLGSLSSCSSRCEVQGNGGMGLHVRGNPIFCQVMKYDQTVSSIHFISSGGPTQKARVEMFLISPLFLGGRGQLKYLILSYQICILFTLQLQKTEYLWVVDKQDQ